jgi:hypothetical protein
VGAGEALEGALACVVGVGSSVSEVRFFRRVFARAATSWSSSFMLTSCDRKDAAASKSSASALANFDFLV